MNNHNVRPLQRVISRSRHSSVEFHQMHTIALQAVMDLLDKLSNVCKIREIIDIQLHFQKVCYLLLGKKSANICNYRWNVFAYIPFIIQNRKYRMFWSGFVNVIFLFLQLFYQIKGDLCLKIIENGKRKDIVIREGEVKMGLLFCYCCT